MICVLFIVGYLRPLEGNREGLLRLAVIAAGLALGSVLAIGLARLDRARMESPLSVPEAAGFEWSAGNPGRVGVLALCLLAAMVLVATLLGGSPIRPALAAVITLLGVLPHEFVCLMRSKGPERPGRLYTVLLVTTSALSVAVGLPFNLAIAGAGGGLAIGLAVLAFIHARSRALKSVRGQPPATPN